MAQAVEDMLARFEDLVRSMPEAIAESERLAPDAYLLRPPGWHGKGWQGKQIALTIMGITHGSEVAGIAVLNEILASLQKGVVNLKIPVAFVLGNVAAAKQGQRFLESDLNRSFMRQTWDTSEHRRARQLEPIIGASRYLLDLHQTRLPSEEPFFIFPFTRGGYEFARQISGETPIVTHWGRPFSKDGRCTDEYCNQQGGAGISLELGQNGIHPYRVASGYKHVIHALEAVTRLSLGEEVDPYPANELYTWAQIIDFPSSGQAELEPGFVNFSSVKAGQKVGQVDGQAIVAQEEGRILFPYYPGSEIKKAPAELCRIMKRISAADLPN